VIENAMPMIRSVGLIHPDAGNIADPAIAKFEVSESLPILSNVFSILSCRNRVEDG
jgi:hypothetical protein